MDERQHKSKTKAAQADIALLTKTINHLKMIRYVSQMEHLIETDETFKTIFDKKLSELSESFKKMSDALSPDTQLTKKAQEKRQSDMRNQALNHTFQALKNRITKLEDTLQKTAIQLVGTPSTTSPFEKLPLDILSHIYTFSDNPVGELSSINRTSRHVIRQGDWMRRLTKEFDMLPEYFSYILKPHDSKIDANAKLRIVYQRLAHLRRNHTDIFNLLYKSLLAGCIDFTPLTVTTSAIPAFDDNKIGFYYNEAVRLRNLRLIENILEKVFIKNITSNLSLLSFICLEAIDAAKQAKNFRLLRSMLAVCYKNINADINADWTTANREYAAKIRIALNEGPQPEKLLADNKGIDYLNTVILGRQFDTARQLIESGITPDHSTWSIYHDFIKIGGHRSAAIDFAFFMLREIESRPNSLQKLGLTSKDPHGEIRSIQSLSLFVAILSNNLFSPTRPRYDQSPLLPHFGSIESWTQFADFLEKNRLDSKLIQSIKNLITDLAVAEGNLALLKSAQFDTKENTITRLMSIAIEHGHIPILHHLATQCNSNSLFTHDVTVAIVHTPHKSIIKFLAEDPDITHIVEKKKETTSSDNEMSARQILTDLNHPSPSFMKIAIRKHWSAVVKYCVEDCHLKPDLEMIEIAIRSTSLTTFARFTKKSYDLFIYLQAQRPDLSLTLAPNTLRQISSAPLSWLDGPEGRKRHFQFTVDHLRDCLSNHSKSFNAIVASEEFPDLFEQLTDNEKRRLFEIAEDYHTDKIIFGLLLKNTDNHNKPPLPLVLSQEIKIKHFAVALTFQDPDFASLFLNKENRFLYAVYSWEDVASIRLESNDGSRVKINLFTISPKMLAWLETALNSPIPDPLLKNYAENFSYRLCRQINYLYQLQSADWYYGIFPNFINGSNDPSVVSHRNACKRMFEEIYYTTVDYQRQLVEHRKPIVITEQIEQTNKSAASVETQHSPKLFSTPLASTSYQDASPLETILDLRKHFDKLNQLESKDDNFNGRIQEIRANINVIERKIRESKTSSSSPPLRFLTRLGENISHVQEHLTANEKDPSFIEYAQKMSECCDRLSQAFSPASSLRKGAPS
jgi:ribosomal protein S15P/S13E